VAEVDERIRVEPVPGVGGLLKRMVLGGSALVGPLGANGDSIIVGSIKSKGLPPTHIDDGSSREARGVTGHMAGPTVSSNSWFSGESGRYATGRLVAAHARRVTL
jgi:hypothetical protein